MNRKFVSIALAGILMISVAASCAKSASADEPAKSSNPADTAKVELTTPSGPICGLRSGEISIYKGIPYAKPPVRFAPPEDVEPWTETLNCENFGSIAVQIKKPERQQGLTMSEDCLTLNVWTPAQSDSEKLPVYVWIHGGGYAQGSSADASYNGTAFAEAGIVLVTINYRLNALGWLATQETLDQYGTTGNWGLLDQIKALEWVQNNIAAFGGDPGCVTIGGESAGSYSVSGLIMSPLAEGLFQNAIMESGSMLALPGMSQYARANLERSIEVGRQLSFSFGAGDDAEGLTKLREADPNVFAQMSPLISDFTDIPSFLMTPTYDGYVMPRKPVESLRNGEVNRVNLLWGFNENEGSLFIPDTTDKDSCEMLAAKMYGYDRGQTVLEHFPVDAEHQAYQQARDILMHGMFAAIMKPYADALYAAGMDVYGYYYNYATPELIASDMGARHGSEIAYAFGNLPPDASDEQKKVSEEMFARWVNFIKSGDPNMGGSPSGITWETYDPQSFKVMIFDKEPVFAENPVRDDVAFMEDIMFGPDSTHFD